MITATNKTMKRFTLLTFMILTVSMFSYGQTSDIDIDNIEFPDISGYAGTWVSIDGSDTLIVNLKFEFWFFEPFNREIPQLFGNYNYTPSSDTQLEMLAIDEGEFTLQGGLFNEHGPRPYLMFNYRDTEIIKTGNLRLYPDESDENILHWQLFENEGVRIQGVSKFIEGYSLPETLTLIRVDSD